MLVVCLLLTLALMSGNASARKRLRPRPRPRRSIWGSIRRNAAEIRKLTRVINQTQESDQEYSPAINTLKENVDDMKEDFVAQTMMMAEMKTSVNDMKEAIEILQKITSEGEIYMGFFSSRPQKPKYLFKCSNVLSTGLQKTCVTSQLILHAQIDVLRGGIQKMLEKL